MSQQKDSCAARVSSPVDDLKSFKISKTVPRVLLLTSASANGLRQISLSLQTDLSSQPDTLDTLCLRSFHDRLKLSENPDMLQWAVAGHDSSSIVAELRRGPISENQLRAIANVPCNSRKLLFVFSGQGSELVGSWHELYKTNQTFASSLDQICCTAKTI